MKLVNFLGLMILFYIHYIFTTAVMNMYIKYTISSVTPYTPGVYIGYRRVYIIT